MSSNQKRKSRWGDRKNNDIISANNGGSAGEAAGGGVSEEEAMLALLAESTAAAAATTAGKEEERKRARTKGGKIENVRKQNPDMDKSRSTSKNSSPSGRREGEDGGRCEEEEEAKRESANFGLSGALVSDDRTGNVYNGVVLKFSEPAEARIPNTRWRLYVFRTANKSNQLQQEPTNPKDNDGDLLEVLHISRQSAYLFGRDRRIADIPVDHPSLSKQHCVLQYRAVPVKNNNQQPADSDLLPKLLCRPYLMDLGSTNGTFINGQRLDDARYYELKKGDVITLGGSSREYVLLTEHTTTVNT